MKKPRISLKMRKRKIAILLCQLGLPLNLPAPPFKGPRQVKISMAFHEAGHAAAALLIGADWLRAHLVRSKREWSYGPMGFSETQGGHDHQLVGAAGQVGEEIWRLRRGRSSDVVPFHGLSDDDRVLMDTALEGEAQEDYVPDYEAILNRARDTLCEHQDLVAWIARRLIRKQTIDKSFLRRKLPTKFYTKEVQRALG